MRVWVLVQAVQVKFDQFHDKYRYPCKADGCQRIDRRLPKSYRSSLVTNEFWEARPACRDGRYALLRDHGLPARGSLGVSLRRLAGARLCGRGFGFRETVRRNSIYRSAMSGSERCATDHAAPRASIRACRWSVTRDHISSRELVSHEIDLTDPHRLSHTMIAKALRMLFGIRSNFWTEGRPSPELRVAKGNSCLRQGLQTDPQSILGTASTGRTARGLILPTSLLPRLRRPSPLCAHVGRMPPGHLPAPHRSISHFGMSQVKCHQI